MFMLAHFNVVQSHQLYNSIDTIRVYHLHLKLKSVEGNQLSLKKQVSEYFYKE